MYGSDGPGGDSGVSAGGSGGLRMVDGLKRPQPFLQSRPPSRVIPEILKISIGLL